MREVERGRRSTADGADAAQGEARAPGRTTRTAALQRKAAPRSTGDVGDAARAELEDAFGERAEGIEYEVDGGAAEERGAHAVTVDGKVDFAPDKLDLGGQEGRARLGEETAHAIQQSNPGAPSNVESLELEAKQAGQDFAAGRAPNVELAAPPDLALADEPKDTDPSTEVPDLQHGEVKAIKKVLASDRPKALKLLLAALQRIDAAKFASTDLVGGKLHAGGGGTDTVHGPKFEKWLAETLDAHAKSLSKKRSELSEDEVKAGLKSAVVPAASLDVKVTIGSGHFESVSLLYSTVRHEFVHVEQIRADPTGYLPSSVMPSGVSSPHDFRDKNDRELEAYLWEMENLAGTGLKDTGELYLLWDKSSDAWNNAHAAAQKKVDPRYGKAFNNVWKLAMDGHIAAIAEHHKAFTKSGKVSDETALYTLQQHLKMMWGYKANFGNKWEGTEAAYKLALKQSEEALGNGPEQELKKAIDKTDKELKAGYTDAFAAYSSWWELLNRWIKVDEEGQKAYLDRYKVTAPAVWDKAFALYEAKINQKLKDGAVDDADTLLYEKIGTLFLQASKSHIKTADYEKRKAALEEAVKKAKKP